MGGVAHHREGIDVGYRYFQRHGQRPLFAFGHGLSYTSFVLLGGSLSAGSGAGVTVTARIRNTGHRPGTAVIQATSRTRRSRKVRRASSASGPT